MNRAYSEESPNLEILSPPVDCDDMHGGLLTRKTHLLCPQVFDGGLYHIDIIG